MSETRNWYCPHPAGSGNCGPLCLPNSCGRMSRPPHFPDPNANPIAILEARIAEQDEMIAGLHREAKAWQAQAEAALARLNELEAK